MHCHLYVLFYKINPMKKIFLLLYFISQCSLFFIPCSAQNKEIDSLLQELKNYDAKKLKLHNNLSPDESDTTKVNLLNIISVQYWNVSEFTKTKKYADEALLLAKQINFKNGIAHAYVNWGITNFRLGNYPEALKNYLTALKTYEETGNKKGIAQAYQNIGPIYEILGNWTEAMNFNLAALKLNEELGDKLNIAKSYSNIGIIYGKRDKYPEALKCFLNALSIYVELGDNYNIANSYNNIGGIYEYQENWTEALKNYFTSLKLREEIGDKTGMVNSLNNIGFGLLSMHKPAEAKKWLMKGLILGKEIGAKRLVREAYESLTYADSALGNFRGAYENQKLYILYNDSLVNEENIRRITRQQMQYDFDKKEIAGKAEQEKKEIRQRNQRFILVGIGFVFLLMAGGLWSRLRYVRRTTAIIVKEKERSEELLLNILPEETAEELKATGRAEARGFDEVSVMFTDFKNFTQTSERLSPAELVKEIHFCYSEFDKIIGKHNLEKIKTIGDSYMCAGGLPVPNKTNAEDMIRAALEIRDFMMSESARRREEHFPYFEIRIGIHTGPVVAGIVGIKKFAYDIWGDTVNIASRMESSGETGKVNISGSTFEIVKDKFTCTHRGKIEAKNKGMVDMYFVEQIS